MTMIKVAAVAVLIMALASAAITVSKWNDPPPVIINRVEAPQ